MPRKPKMYTWTVKIQVAECWDAFSDCICGVIQRIQDLDLPAITSHEPESTETWARTADYFRRLNRSVPFTEDELSGLLADTLTPKES